MVLGIALVIIGLVMLGLIQIDRLPLQLRGLAAAAAAFGVITILLTAFG